MVLLKAFLLLEHVMSAAGVDTKCLIQVFVTASPGSGYKEGGANDTHRDDSGIGRKGRRRTRWSWNCYVLVGFTNFITMIIINI